MVVAEVNEKGPMAEVLARYTDRQLKKHKKKLELDKKLRDKNSFLVNLQDMNEKLTIVMQQNYSIISYLEKLTNGPSGIVHFIKIPQYSKSFGEIFIDFVRGERNSNTKLPSNAQYTYPYSKVFMIKITNDGPADISFQTNRHARMIELKAGESDVISENESFALTELRMSNQELNDAANIRIVVYA